MCGMRALRVIKDLHPQFPNIILETYINMRQKLYYKNHVASRP